MEQQKFKPREVYFLKEELESYEFVMPESMRNHIKEGGQVFMMEAPQNGQALISTTENSIGGISSFINMDYVVQEVTLKDDVYGLLPHTMQEHVQNGGKLYMEGEPENGIAFISMAKDMHSTISTTVCASDLINDYAADNENDLDFTDAVAAISEPDDQMTR